MKKEAFKLSLYHKRDEVRMHHKLGKGLNVPTCNLWISS